MTTIELINLIRLYRISTVSSAKFKFRVSMVENEVTFENEVPLSTIVNKLTEHKDDELVTWNIKWGK